MRISVIIIISLAANLALAALWFRQSSSGGAKSGGAMENSATAPGTGSVKAENSSGTADDNSVAAIVGRFSWRDLTAPDLKEYILKLRAANCPEVTVQDLILAEVNRQYSAKNAALQDPEWLTQNTYWKPYQQNRDLEKAKKNNERYKAIRDLQKEKTALIVELFGFDVEKQRLKEEGYDPDNNWNYITGDLSYLPEAKREPVQKYLDAYQEKMQEFYTRVSGGWDAAARVEQKKLEDEKLAGLAQFLTPQEVREYELRNSQVAQQITSDLHGVDITREQYEAMFDIRKKYGDSVYNWGSDGNDPNGPVYKQIQQNQKDMQAEIATALGADKGAELTRAEDYQYQQLKSLARHNDLPADTANKVYDFKQAAEKAVADLQANQDLTPEQRQTALTQIRTETQQSVQTALGDKLFSRYQRNGGYWINQLAPTPPKPKTP